jgi:hypothetical protein
VSRGTRLRRYPFKSQRKREHLATIAGLYHAHDQHARHAPATLSISFLHYAIMSHDHARIIAETRAWVDRAVIGLNLCPFAKAVQVKGLVRYVVSEATDTAGLLDYLRDELRFLVEADPKQIDTTILIHPHVLSDFLDYSYFLPSTNGLLKSLGLSGALQIASFHPDYQFADSEPDDVANATNRSPYPILHLLREDSIDRAVAAFPDPESIYANNMTTLEALGHAGWQALREACRQDAEKIDRDIEKEK